MKMKRSTFPYCRVGIGDKERRNYIREKSYDLKKWRTKWAISAMSKW